MTTESDPKKPPQPAPATQGSPAQPDAADHHDFENTQVLEFADTTVQDFANTEVHERAELHPRLWAESADGRCSQDAALFAASQPAPLNIV